MVEKANNDYQRAKLMEFWKKELRPHGVSWEDCKREAGNPKNDGDPDKIVKVFLERLQRNVSFEQIYEAPNINERTVVMIAMSREIAWENSLLDTVDALMDQGLTQDQAVSVVLSEQIEPDYKD